MTDEREATRLVMLEASTGSQGAAAKIVADTWLGLDEARKTLGATIPLDMVLHCPNCGLQHIDAPHLAGDANAPPFPTEGMGHEDAQPLVDALAEYEASWTNPPHRSHLCAGCNHVWRPADVCTNGVAAVATKGRNDSPMPMPSKPPAKLLELANRIDHEQLWSRAGLERDGWTQEQHDRCDAGVHLRRYADLLSSECWRIYPPSGIPTRFSAATLDGAIAMARRHEAQALMKATPISGWGVQSIGLSTGGSGS